MTLLALSLVVLLALRGGGMTDSTSNHGGAFETTTTTRPVHFYFLLDRSGSMSSLRNDVVGGMNGYVEEMIREHTLDDTTEDNPNMMMTLVQFDSVDPHEVTHDALDLVDVPKWTTENFNPRGSTPLYDAIGKIISRAERRNSEEDPVIIVMTDGEENASREHDKGTISRLIESKKEAGWAFVFLGANIDAFDAGGGIAVSGGNTQNFHADGYGMKKAFESLSKSSSRYAKAQGKASKGDASGAAELLLLSDNFFEGHNEAQMDYESRESASKTTPHQQASNSAL